MHFPHDPASGVVAVSAVEWLDAVRADLDTVSRFGRELDEAVTSREGRSVLAIADDLDDAHNALDGTAPDRPDRMERALRDVLELAESWRYKGEFGFDDGSHAYVPDPKDEALDWASAERVTTIQEVLR